MTLFNPGSRAAKLQELAFQERRRALIERRFGRLLAREIARAGREAAEGYRVGLGFRPAMSRHRSRLEAILRRLYSQAVTAGAEHAESSLPRKGARPGGRKQVEASIAETLRRWLGARAARFAVLLMGTTEATVSSVLVASEREGLSELETARAISSKITGLSPGRGARIARTEAHGAAVAGNIQTVRGLGLGAQTEKEWVAAVDDRTRSSHAEVSGESVPMSSSFQVDGESMDHPGDPDASARNVINCRCVLIYNVSDEALQGAAA